MHEVELFIRNKSLNLERHFIIHIFTWFLLLLRYLLVLKTIVIDLSLLNIESMHFLLM